MNIKSENCHLWGASRVCSWGATFFLYRYVNDLPSSSNFKTTLFADNTLLQLSDCNIKKLEKRVSNELNKINVWLRNNKISLNISKTNYSEPSFIAGDTFQK